MSSSSVQAIADAAEPQRVVETPPAPQGFVRGLVFRFAFVYWTIFCVPIISSQIDVMEWSGKAIDAIWTPMVTWVGKHILAIPYELSLAGTGSGDKTADWVGLFCTAALALIVSVVWSLVDRRRRHDARLREVLRILIRYTLAFVLLEYGVDKLFFGQFPPPNDFRLTQRYGDSSPMGLLWTFMGSSRAYVFFAGAGETLGALLILFRRTTTLGALVLAGVLTNVVMLNFCYDVPVKINSTHYLAMAIFLMLPDLGRLANVLFFHRPTQPAASRALVLKKRWMRVARWVVKFGAVGFVLFTILKSEVKENPGPAAKAAWYDGTWTVQTFTPESPQAWLRLRLESAQGTHYLRWHYPGKAFSDLYTFAIDETQQTLTLTRVDESGAGEHPTSPVAVKYVRVDDDHLDMEFKVDANTYAMRVEHLHPEKMLLTTRGFHWINEVPFNR